MQISKCNSKQSQEKKTYVVLSSEMDYFVIGDELCEYVIGNE